MPIPHPDGRYAITTTYSVPDDAWYLELDEVAGQRTLVLAIVPDEDPGREPTVCFTSGDGHRDVPYAVMRWFMDQVAEDIRTSRSWMELRPETVGVIHGLRQEHLGVLADEDVPPVLAGLRARVPAADLADVMLHAFGRGPDGRIL
ncbi:hypothetical protein [Streptomyces sp. NK15101]|uniref:hypothetical protein n=1 Tax=Streptomyces sp. NK15101 TaxID=2873261 RepID=UPI001CED10A8|nr:hypothetical protein [Streptomyces sp. NK15101]